MKIKSYLLHFRIVFTLIINSMWKLLFLGYVSFKYSCLDLKALFTHFYMFFIYHLDLLGWLCVFGWYENESFTEIPYYRRHLSRWNVLLLNRNALEADWFNRAWAEKWACHSLFILRHLQLQRQNVDARADAEYSHTGWKGKYRPKISAPSHHKPRGNFSLFEMYETSVFL